MTTTHTPGPWNYSGPCDIGRDNYSIYAWGPLAYSGGPSDLGDAAEANARLIAAAPELLAALKEWTSIAVNSGLEGCDEILEQAEAAIVKAEEVQA
jgi:hypothetical protein